MAGPARRSGRERKVNPKYANDGWDKETLRVLRASSESSGSSPAEGSEIEVLQEDVDFKTAKAGMVDNDSQQGDGDDASGASAVGSQSSAVDTPDEDDLGDMSIASDEDMPATGKGRNKRRRLQSGAAPSTSATTHSRGLQSAYNRGAKELIYHVTFGPEVDDLSDVLRARDTWLRGRDITLPSRRTLSHGMKQLESLKVSPGVETDDDPASKVPRTRPAPSLDDTMNSKQKLMGMGHTTLYERYLLRGKPHSVVLGPRGKQQQFLLDFCSPLDFGQAWSIPPSENVPDQEASSQHRYHEGWFISVGEKVQCLAWAAHDGPTQYLAIVTQCKSQQRRFSPGEDNGRPAFHPSPPYPSAIQIWAFHTKPTNHAGVRTLSMETQPRLAMVIGTEWGDIRQIKWCPSEDSTSSPPEDPKSATSVIGLLGVISSDGFARVVAVPVPSEQDGAYPTAFKAEQAAFTIPPPEDTIFTALAFATTTDLICGAADGSVHLFDLSEATSNEGILRAYTKHQIHNNYVVSLCSATPSPFSTFIASTSASGDLVLTDLRSPEQDQVSVTRACFPNRDLVYSPLTHSFLSALDRAGNTHIEVNSATFVVCHHIRQFPTSLRLARLPDHSGAATTMAGSPWHPCLLVGNAKGQVLATNYLRKVLPYRRSDTRKAVGAYLHRLCEYDWRPLTATERGNGFDLEPGTAPSADAPQTPADEDIDLYHGHDARPGASRFHEGFKPDRIEVGHVPHPRKKTQKQELGAAEAVFEEEQAVCVVQWNPNLSCAGLAAMGWGSGVVRVQDLAHDLE